MKTGVHDCDLVLFRAYSGTLFTARFLSYPRSSVGNLSSTSHSHMSNTRRRRLVKLEYDYTLLVFPC